MASELSPVPDDLGFEPTIRGPRVNAAGFRPLHVAPRYWAGAAWASSGWAMTSGWSARWRSSFCPTRSTSIPRALDELKRETRRCLELTHPNIIRIYDFVKDEQAAAISMEYIDGQTLAALRIEQPARVFEVRRPAQLDDQGLPGAALRA